MSKLPQLTKLRKDDLGNGLPPWMDKVIYSFNRLADSMYSALNNGLTVQENMKAEVFKITIYPADLPYSMSAKYPITDLVVTSISEVSGSRVNFTSPVWADWVYDASNTNVVLYNISGLTSGKQYKIRLMGFSEVN